MNHQKEKVSGGIIQDIIWAIGANIWKYPKKPLRPPIHTQKNGWPSTSRSLNFYPTPSNEIFLASSKNIIGWSNSSTSTISSADGQLVPSTSTFPANFTPTLRIIKGGLCWVIAFSDFEGGELSFDQMNIEFAMGKGECCGFQESWYFALCQTLYRHQKFDSSLHITRNVQQIGYQPTTGTLKHLNKPKLLQMSFKQVTVTWNITGRTRWLIRFSATLTAPWQLCCGCSLGLSQQHSKSK